MNGEDEYRVERLGGRTLVGVPLEVTMATLPIAVEEAFDVVETTLEQAGVDHGEGIIRYKRLDPDGQFSIEVGYAVEDERAEVRGLETDHLPGGSYAIAVHEGPYAGLAGKTRSFLAWSDASGLRPSMEVTSVGSQYRCYYESYPDRAIPGPEGPGGYAEIRMLLG